MTFAFSKEHPGQRRRRTTGLGPTRNPLYLLDGPAREVGIQGPSLVLKVRGYPNPQRIPLDRIERIVCGVNTSWQGSALCTCFAKGIPITWINGKGRAEGMGLPTHDPDSPINDAILGYVNRMGWEKRYANWLRSRRMNVLAHWTRSVGKDRRVNAQALENLKREFVYHDRMEDFFIPDAQGWCTSVATQLLLTEQIAPTYWGHGGRAMNLANDLGHLYWAAFNLHCGGLARQAPRGPEALLLFEHWEQRHQGRILQHLGDLKKHIRVESAVCL